MGEGEQTRTLPTNSSRTNTNCERVFKTTYSKAKIFYLRNRSNDRTYFGNFNVKEKGRQVQEMAQWLTAPGFDPQHPYNGTESFINPVPGDSAGIHMYTYTGKQS